MDREELLVDKLSEDALKTRLAALGHAPRDLPADISAQRRLCAEGMLRERSQAVSFPLRKTPRNPRAGKSFFVVPIDVGDIGFVNFLLDSGSSGALITSELRETLGLTPLDGQAVRGVDSGGLTVRQKVRLPPLRLGPAPLAISEGYVTTLKSDHDVEVGGVLGLSFLRQWELDVCQDRQRLWFHPPGHIAQGVLDVEGMTCLACEALKGGLLAVPVSLNGSPRFPAILDLGANTSILNWRAAELAGVRRDGAGAEDGREQPPRQGRGLQMQEVVGVDGQRGANRMCRGDLHVVLGAEGSTFEAPRPLAVMVRDIPSFAALGFGDQPIMVLGYDLLSADRLVLDLANNRIFVK